MSVLAHELVQWSAALRSRWLDPIEKELRTFQRFFAALAGSITFFVGWVAFKITVEPEIFFGFIAFETFPIAIIFVTFIIYALVFACLVAWPAKKVGPIRLYFSGLLLPVITWSILRFTLSS